jgi:hypothetical protein
MANKSWTEIERTFDVGSTTVLPTMLDLDRVSRVGQAVELVLEAVYFDTVDLDLARRGVSALRSTGGADEGVLQLLGRQLVRTRFDLDQGGPVPGPTRDPDQAVGVEAPLAKNERDLDEALDRAAWRAEGLHEPSPELFDR